MIILLTDMNPFSQLLFYYLEKQLNYDINLSKKVIVKSITVKHF